MTATRLDGKKLSHIIRASIREEIAAYIDAGEDAPGLAVLLVGDDPASAVYVRNKQLACEQVGIHSTLHTLSAHTQQADILDLLAQWNQDPKIHGILVQLPLPSGLNTAQIIDKIHPDKDVDGFHPYNLGSLAAQHPILRPCTPKGIITLLKHYKITLKPSTVTIVGASNIVGRPMALEALLAGATVTICHRFTPDLEQCVSNADILISAIGKPGIIQNDWLHPTMTVIDVGITRDTQGKLRGDIDFEDALQRVQYITPVPGGVGPMTIASLLQNTLQAYQLQKNR